MAKPTKPTGESVDINDMSMDDMIDLQNKLADRMRKDALREIKALEDKANEIRGRVGLKRRPGVRSERPVKK